MRRRRFSKEQELEDEGVVPFHGRTDATTVGLASAMVDVAVRLSRRLRLRVGARIGVALPPIHVDTGAGSHRTALPIGEAVVALDLFGPRAAP